MAVTAAMGSPTASSARLVDAVATGGVRLALSDDYMDEMTRTMAKPYLEQNASVGRVFRIALTLAYMGVYYHPFRYDWPSIPHHADWWLLDLAFGSGADSIVTWNMRHLEPARSLGFEVLTPPELLARLPA